MFKKYFYSLGIFSLSILVINLLLTLVSYFSLLSPKVTSIIYLVLMLIALFVSSYLVGTKSQKKGYLEGIKFGGIVVILFTLFVIIFDKFAFKSLIYYAILMLTSVLGSMIGINKRAR